MKNNPQSAYNEDEAVDTIVFCRELQRDLKPVIDEQASNSTKIDLASEYLRALRLEAQVLTLYCRQKSKFSKGRIGADIPDIGEDSRAEKPRTIRMRYDQICEEYDKYYDRLSERSKIIVDGGKTRQSLAEIYPLVSHVAPISMMGKLLGREGEEVLYVPETQVDARSAVVRRIVQPGNGKHT